MCKEVSDWDPRQLGAHPRAGGAAPESQERSRASGREGRSVVPSARGWQRPSAAGPASSRSTNRLQDAALRTHRLSRRQPSSPTHRGSRSPRGFQTLAPKPRSHKSRGDVMTPHAARAPPGSQAVRAAALGLRAAGPGGAAQQSPWNWTGRRLLGEPSEGRPVSTPRLPPLLASPVRGPRAACGLRQASVPPRSRQPWTPRVALGGGGPVSGRCSLWSGRAYSAARGLQL